MMSLEELSILSNFQLLDVQEAHSYKLHHKNKTSFFSRQWPLHYICIEEKNILTPQSDLDPASSGFWSLVAASGPLLCSFYFPFWWVKPSSATILFGQHIPELNHIGAITQSLLVQATSHL
jgi:hypothetical protein